MREKILAILVVVILIALFVATAIGFYFGAKGLYLIYLQNKYPLKYATQIATYSTRYSLEPSLVSAVIYEESSFDPNSNSAKGAVGLMQILPETGRYIAGKLREEDFAESSLTDAETNIRYGCYYLSYLSQRYGNLDNVLAAYNAGEGNVDKWLKNGDKVPFLETENFIKRVKTSQEYYKRLYFEGR